MRAPPDPEKFIDLHLYNELRWLLVAAVTWKSCRESTHPPPVPNLIVMAMDSALVHSRSLYEFFIGGSKKNACAMHRDFLGHALRSDLYQVYEKSINKALMHPDASRQVLEPAPATDDALNAQVERFAADIIRLFREFAEELPDSKLKESAALALLKSRNEAARQAEALGIHLPWLDSQ